AALPRAAVCAPSPARSATAPFAAPEPPPPIRGAAPPGPGAYNRTHAEPAARSPARPRPRPWRRGRSHPAEAAASADVLGDPAQRRLHPDGLRGRGADALLPDDRGEGDPDHAPCAYPRPRRLRGIHARGGRIEGSAGQRVFPHQPAPIAVHHGEGLTPDRTPPPVSGP